MADESNTDESAESAQPTGKRAFFSSLSLSFGPGGGRPNPFNAGFTYHTHHVSRLALAPDGSAVAFSDGALSIQVCYPEQPEASFTFTDHTSPITGLAWSPDGRYIASTAGGEANTNEILVWEVATRQVIARYQRHEGTPLTVCWSPDSTRLVSAGLDKAVHIWEALTGTQLMTYQGHEHSWINAAVWSPDGTLIASAGIDGTVQLWEAATGKVVTIYRGHHGGVNAVAWSPDGSMLVSGGDDQTVQVWRAATRELLYSYTYHPKRIMNVDWAANGQRVRSSGWDGTVREWDATTGRNVWLFHMPATSHEGQAATLVWTADLAVIAQGIDDRRALVAYLNTGKLYICRVPSSIVELLGEAPEQPSKMRIRQGTARHIAAWPGGPDARPQVYRGHTTAVAALAWSPDSTRVASGGHDMTIHIWDAAHQQTLLLCRGHSDAISALAWSPDGTKLASSSLDKTVRVWDVKNGQELLSYNEHDNQVRALSWSPDGRLIVSAGADKTARIWDITSGQTRLTYRRHGGLIRALGWSPDGRFIASGGADKTVVVWDAQSGQERYVYRGHSEEVIALQWLPDSRRIVSLSDHGVPHFEDEPEYVSPLHIWYADGVGEALLCQYEHFMLIHSIACSPDGKYVAVDSHMSRMIVYDAAGGQEIAHVGLSHSHDQRGRIVCLAWSPDGQLIAAAMDKGEVCLWRSR
jgi:WD40 repeat protein